MSLEICSLFPNENKETYYTPYKKESFIVSPARGKLWDKYNNLRKEIRKSNPKLATKNTSNSSCVPNEGIVNSKHFFIFTMFILKLFLFLELAEDLLWLKNNISPWNIVEDKWLKTFQERYNYLLLIIMLLSTFVI